MTSFSFCRLSGNVEVEKGGMGVAGISGVMREEVKELKEMTELECQK